MDLGAVCEEDLGRSPCLAAGCDATSLRLSPTEGYLFSRIDGQTPWRLLREMGGMAPDDVDLCIETWLADDLIKLAGSARKPRAGLKRSRTGVVIPGRIDEGEIDESLEIDVEMQRRILDLQSRLDAGYAEILGVSPDADGKAIKQAYRALSRDFHPDRYFRKQIGGYEARLETVFKKVLEAYELLSDPKSRRELQKGPSSEKQASPGRTSSPTPIERLRQRMPFRISKSIRNERRARARAFYESARTWAEKGHPLEAASSIRLAIAFDPAEELYKTTFAEIQAGFSDGKVADLLQASREWVKVDQMEQGLKQCEEALLYRPHDPDLNETAARCALVLGEQSAAFEYAERALEHSPDVGRYHRTLARVLEESGDKKHAICELQRALELDGRDGVAREMLENLKLRRVVNGGSE
jgi:tetratricopeptide (TPR) repeat protein